ncbi:MAG TPA: response regulator [Bacteroidales bacterium]|nr:response regulator [Bacteroidales bacterium]
MKNKISIGIVDDEPDAVALIEMIIKEFCHEAEVVMTANLIDQAWEKIKQTKPELLILDIDMPRGSGFDLLERFPIRKFDVIFVTAFSKYRDKAKRYGAYDYLLKPLDIERFTGIIRRFDAERSARTAVSFKLKP